MYETEKSNNCSRIEEILSQEQLERDLINQNGRGAISYGLTHIFKLFTKRLLTMVTIAWQRQYKSAGNH